MGNNFVLINDLGNITRDGRIKFSLEENVMYFSIIGFFILKKTFNFYTPSKFDHYSPK